MKEYTYYSGEIFQDYNADDAVVWVAAIGGWTATYETEAEAKQHIKDYLGRK